MGGLKRGERVFSKKLHYCELMVFLSSACIPFLSLIVVVFKHAYHNCSNLVHLFTKIHWSILHCWWQRLNGGGHRQHRDKTVAWVHACVSVCMCLSVWVCGWVCGCVSVWAWGCVSVWVCEYMSGKTKKWSARALVCLDKQKGDQTMLVYFPQECQAKLPQFVKLHTIRHIFCMAIEYSEHYIWTKCMCTIMCMQGAVHVCVNTQWNTCWIKKVGLGVMQRHSLRKTPFSQIPGLISCVPCMCMHYII